MYWYELSLQQSLIAPGHLVKGRHVHIIKEVLKRQISQGCNTGERGTLYRGS